MTFQEAIRAVLSKYADFNGRARRSEYWYAVLAYVGIVIIGEIIVGVLGQMSGLLGMLGGLVLAIAFIGLYVPILAAAVRRMHDTDHSGWWILCPIVPLIFALTDGTPGDNRFGPSPKGITGAAAYPPPPPAPLA